VRRWHGAFELYTPVWNAVSGVVAELSVTLWLNIGVPTPPQSRRELREQERQSVAHRKKRKRPLIRSFRLWIPVVLVLIIVGLGLTALWIGPRAFEAKDQLEAAIPLAKQVESHLVKSESEPAQQAARKMQQHTAKAHELTSDDVWKALEWVPVVGANLKAVRLAAESADELTREAVVPVSQIDIDALKPKDGRIDVEAVRGLQGTVNAAAKALDHANERMAQIDRKPLISQVAGGVGKLDDALGKANDLIVGVQNAVNLMPAALGADGPRNYLMLFENNAEARGWAGNPAALLMLTVNDGVISIGRQASTADFPYGLTEPVVPLDPATVALYGDKIGRFIQDTTTTIDYPYTAQLATIFWQRQFGSQIDGVLSFDPVALGYLIKATGPITLPTGEKLTAKNASDLLLNEVYFKYPDPKVQDAFFAAAAASVFDVLQSGAGNTKGLIDALAKAVDEHRLLYYSFHEEEQKVIATTPLVGLPPTSNTEQSAVGVFINDLTAAKMDFYLRPTIEISSDQCTAPTPTMTAKVTLTNIAPPDAQDRFPDYVLGFRTGTGTIYTDVVLYGLVGGQIGDIQVDGQPATANIYGSQAPLTYQGEHLGRPAAKVYVETKPGATVTITYTMNGPAGAYGPLKVLTTGMPHPTTITTDTPGCRDQKQTK